MNKMDRRVSFGVARRTLLKLVAGAAIVSAPVACAQTGNVKDDFEQKTEQIILPKKFEDAEKVLISRIRMTERALAIVDSTLNDKNTNPEERFYAGIARKNVLKDKERYEMLLKDLREKQKMR